MSRRAYVLLSGGVDSTTCLYLAQRQFGEVIGLSVDYGQRHKKEIEYARTSCEKLAATHRVLDLSSVVPRTVLTDPEAAIPRIPYAEIKGVSPVYVPFRNGLLLSAATAHMVGERKKALEARSREIAAGGDPFRNCARLPDGGCVGRDCPHNPELGEWGLYFGAHAEDAHNWAYADCTPEFVGAMATAIYVGTYHQVRLHTPLEWLDKEAIVRLGQSLRVDWRLTWSCYFGGERHCGECPTCRARRAGFAAAGVVDPTIYLRCPAA